MLLFTFLTLTAAAQNPATAIQLSSKEIVLPCETICTSITATVPHLKQSDDYLVQPVPYQPFAFAAGGTELVSLYADDIYSSVIPLPFPVCFYGTNFTSLVVGSNGIISFDITNANRRNNFRQTVNFSNKTPVPIPFAGGTQGTLTSTYYPRAAILGVYHDIFPTDNGLRRIEWRIEGTAPKRRFLASFKDVPMFSCSNLLATHQIVIYESTGVVEVYVQDKPVCTVWNEGLATLGMQNFNRNKATFPVGKNAGKWGRMGLNEAYRFTPSAGLSKFKKAELIANGTVVALADTTTSSNGDLQLNFANVCPTAENTPYLLRVTYGSCTNITEEISFEETLTIKKAKLEIDLQTQHPTCTTGGIITVNASGSSTENQYSLNGGAAQTSNVFTNLSKGKYTVTVSNATCTKTATATLTLIDDLTLSASPAVTICAGETFTPQINSNATSFNWSPSQGISNTHEANPQIRGETTTTYTLTATKGVCEKIAQLQMNVKPLPTVHAGSDQTIVQGDVIGLAATASAGSYEWTPSTGLSAALALNPTAMPANTITYRLTVTNDGCRASDEVTINVAPYCVKPMEAFTPNGDGINDLWMITSGNCLEEAKVEVFNRYGAKVYQSNDYKNNWNGTYGGSLLADGTYYYIITYQLINGKKVFMKGNVTILR